MTTPTQAAVLAAINEIDRSRNDSPERACGYYIQELLDTQREQDAKTIAELTEKNKSATEAFERFRAGLEESLVNLASANSKVAELQINLRNVTACYEEAVGQVAELTKRVEELESRERQLIEDWYTNRSALEDTLHHFKQASYKAEAAVAEMRDVLERIANIRSICHTERELVIYAVQWSKSALRKVPTPPVDLELLKADHKRMEWIEKEKHCVEWLCGDKPNDPGYCCVDIESQDWNRYKFPTAREAIDDRIRREEVKPCATNRLTSSPAEPLYSAESTATKTVASESAPTSNPEAREDLWDKDMPITEGEWWIISSETDYEPECVTIRRNDGALWVDSEIGSYPLETFHANLIDIHWRPKRKQAHQG
jgi:hypothetical protein